MNKSPLSPLSPDQPWPRDYLIELSRIALAVDEAPFVRRAALSWLSVYPGDLNVQLLHAQALWQEGRFEQAQGIARELCQLDPEFLEAQELRVLLADLLDAKDPSPYWGELYALDPGAAPFQAAEMDDIIPEWSKDLALVRSHVRDGNIESANYALQDVLGADPESPLAAVTHLETMLADAETPVASIHDLASHYQDKYPDCLLCTIAYGNSLIKTGQSEKGVSILHKAASQDISAQVPERLWGKDHNYRDLWPGNLQAHLDLRVPAAVSASLGWNQLPEGGAGIQKSISEDSLEEEPAKAKAGSVEKPQGPPQGTPPETLKSIQEELEKVAQKLGKEAVTRSDGRFPMYVVFSTQKGLEDKYGPKTAEIIKEEMKKVSRSVCLKPGWGSIVLFADDPDSMAKFDLKPTLADDAWALKLALADLDKALGKKGLMIGALLIVGGPDVVPYHHLPNPVEDVDEDVPSDNPYATQDENYFIPEWPVGRIPGSKGNDPGVLLDMLRQISDHHMGKGEPERRWWESILHWFWTLFVPQNPHNSFGYVAEAWKKASHAVFESIKEKGDLVTSPPFGKNHEIPVPLTRLGYYNLHGVENDGAWYGQKDLTNGKPGPDYPVALRPEDINAYENAPLFVFTEACYGIHLNGRALKDSIALSYLSKGTYTVVGSTVTSYGSIAAPLIAADLLAESYWTYIQRGHTSGEALQKAKVRLAKIMHKRQGYLDGEDQKTLISFNLFGDPLASPQDAKRKQPKAVWRPKETPAVVKTVCDRSAVSKDIPSETMKHVKQVVKNYLPGMEDADMVISTEVNRCSGKGHRCPTAELGEKVHSKQFSQRRVVTLSKSFEFPQHGTTLTHRHYARVTFDETGEMVKLAVSR